MSNALASIGFTLIVVAIAALFGVWVGVLVLGCVFLLAAYAMHKNRKPLASGTVADESKGR